MRNTDFGPLPEENQAAAALPKGTGCQSALPLLLVPGEGHLFHQLSHLTQQNTAATPSLG